VPSLEPDNPAGYAIICDLPPHRTTPEAANRHAYDAFTGQTVDG